MGDFIQDLSVALAELAGGGDTLQLDVYRAGPDRQELAPPIRITHIPSGESVTCDRYPSHWENHVMALVELIGRKSNACDDKG